MLVQGKRKLCIQEVKHWIFQSYFYKLKKGYKQPAYNDNSKNTKRSSLTVVDPGRLDIQPASGRKEGIKQQLPKAEMRGLDLH